MSESNQSRSNFSNLEDLIRGNAVDVITQTLRSIVDNASEERTIRAMKGFLDETLDGFPEPPPKEVYMEAAETLASLYKAVHEPPPCAIIISKQDGDGKFTFNLLTGLGVTKEQFMLSCLQASREFPGTMGAVVATEAWAMKLSADPKTGELTGGEREKEAARMRSEGKSLAEIGEKFPELIQDTFMVCVESKYGLKFMNSTPTRDEKGDKDFHLDVIAQEFDTKEWGAGSGRMVGMIDPVKARAMLLDVIPISKMEAIEFVHKYRTKPEPVPG